MFYPTKLHTLTFVIRLSCLIWIYVESLKVTPERANMTFYNKKYIEKAFVNVRRYSRNSLYYMNFWGETKKTLGNDMKVDVIFKEFLHNEYRPSFIEFHASKLCDFINNDPYIGIMLKKFNDYSCPYVPGEYNFMNITVPSEKFPNKFPFKKGLVDFIVRVAATNELVLKFYFEVTFEQKHL